MARYGNLLANQTFVLSEHSNGKREAADKHTRPEDPGRTGQHLCGFLSAQYTSRQL
jgi:hypothetical protein